MDCVNCGDDIDPPADTRFEQVTPVSGGQTTDEYCSIACLNEDAGFSQDEIESLMRQAGYEVPPDLESNWMAFAEPEESARNNTAIPQGHHFVAFHHIEKECDVEIYWDHEEALFEVNVWEYDLIEGEKMGYDTTSTTRTGTHQRAVKHARDYMDAIESGSY